MFDRRNFLKSGARAIVPAAALAAAGSTAARADDGKNKDLLGAWNSVHSLPFPPGSFREFMIIDKDGSIRESNSFLNLVAPQDFSAFGLPNAVKAGEGFGSWQHDGKGQFSVVFRKMLFNGSGANFGDLRVTGTVKTDGTQLMADWMIDVVDLAGNVILPFGPATSQGVRIA